MILYADTSALGKLLLREAGSAEMRAAVGAADPLVCATIGYVELRAVLAAAFRARRIRPSRQAIAKISLENLWERLTWVPVDASLIQLAGDLAERWALRGYDAVHLAALCQLPPTDEVEFACWDSDLRHAAGQLGYRLLPAS